MGHFAAGLMVLLLIASACAPMDFTTPARLIAGQILLLLSILTVQPAGNRHDFWVRTGEDELTYLLPLGAGLLAHCLLWLRDGVTGDTLWAFCLGAFLLRLVIRLIRTGFLRRKKVLRTMDLGQMNRPVPAALTPLGMMGRFWPLYLMVHYIDRITQPWLRVAVDLPEWGWTAALRCLMVFLVGTALLITMSTLSGGKAVPEDALTWIRAFAGRHDRFLNVLSYVTFALLFLKLYFNTSMLPALVETLGWLDSVNRIQEVLLRLALLLCVITLATLREKRELLFAILVLSAGFLHRYTGYDFEILVFSLFVVLLAGRKSDPVLRISLGIGVLVLYVAWLCTMNGLTLYVLYGSKHAMGMNYSTDLAAHLFYLVAAVFWLRRGKLTAPGFVFYVFVTEYFIWHITGCRIDTIAAILLLAGTFFYMFLDKAFDWIMRHVRYLVRFVYVVLCALMVILTVTYRPGASVWGKIPGVTSFTERLNLGQRGLKEHAISFLGTYVEEHGNGGTNGLTETYFFIDSSYIRMVLLYGILFLTAYLIAETVLLLRLEKKQAYYAMFLLLIVAITGLIDHHIADPSYNIFGVLVLTDLCWEPRKGYWETVRSLFRKEKATEGGKKGGGAAGKAAEKKQTLEVEELK